MRLQTYTVPASLTGTLSREYIGWVVRRPSWIALWAVQIVAVVVVFAVGVESGDWFPLFVVIVAASAAAGVLLAAFTLTRRSIRLSYPQGFSASAAVGEDALFSATAIGSATLTYRGIRAVHATRHGVILQMRGSGAAAIAPRALFTDDDMALLGERVRAAAPLRANPAR